MAQIVITGSVHEALYTKEETDEYNLSFLVSLDQELSFKQ